MRLKSTHALFKKLKRYILKKYFWLKSYPEYKIEFSFHKTIENICFKVYMSKKYMKGIFVKIYKDYIVSFGGSHKSQTAREISGNYFLVAL